VCICWSVVFYILKYVVATAVRRGAWEEVDTPVHATEGVLSLQMLHSCSVFPLAGACDTMHNKCFYSIYRAVFESVLHSHFIVHCVRRRRL
jgi:hypothetical protein